MANQKVVWITGASSGIGKELAIQYSQKGYQVVLSSRKKEALELVQKELAHPENTLVLPLDLENSSEFGSLSQQVFDKFGRIDILINNGGISQRSEVSETDMEVYRKLMEINFFGNIALTKVVLPFMKKQGSGHIVTISSIAGKFGFFLRSGYASAKHALQGFYESLYLEEEKNGIRVTIAYPGKINTPISQSAIKGDGSTHGEQDHNQATGMPADQCAKILIDAINKNKLEVLIGGKEIKAVKVKRLFPKLFWKVIKKQSAT
ncbi:MAG: SDR family oxidoreductase [Crocinitomicaceae bacterium]